MSRDFPSGGGVACAALLVLSFLVSGIGTVTVGVPDSYAQEGKLDLRVAKKRFREGKELFDEEQYLEAAQAFRDAYELSQRPELLYNLGQAYRLGGKLEEAEKYFQQYLAEMPDARNADAVVETIIEVQQQIAARMASVQVITAEEGREVHIDDESEPRCETPCTVSLPPGSYRLRVTGERAREHVREIDLAPAQKLTLEIGLEREIVPGHLVLWTDRPSGRLRVGTDIDAVLPLQSPIQLEPGEYPVEVQSTRDVSWRGQVRIEPEQTTRVMVPMGSLVEAERKSSIWKKVSYGLWGLSAAFTAGGLVMGIQTQDTWDLLIRQRAANNLDAGLIDQGESQQFAANIMFGLGVTSVASGIGLYLWDEWSAEQEETAASPRPTPSSTDEAGEAEKTDQAPASDSAEEPNEPSEEPALFDESEDSSEAEEDSGLEILD